MSDAPDTSAAAASAVPPADTASAAPQGRSKLLPAILVVAALVAALVLLPIDEWMTAALDWVDGLGWWGPVALVGMYIVACVFLIPGSILTLGAGAAFGVVKGSITVSVAATLGAAAAFLVGRYVARAWVEKKVAGNERFAAVDEAVGREGFKIVFLTRLSPVFPFSILNYAYGLTAVSFRNYFLASWVGMIPGTIMYVYLGSAAKDVVATEQGGSPAQTALKVVGLVATIVVTVYVTRIARKALDKEVSQ